MGGGSLRRIRVDTENLFDGGDAIDHAGLLRLPRQHHAAFAKLAPRAVASGTPQFGELLNE